MLRPLKRPKCVGLQLTFWNREYRIHQAWHVPVKHAVILIPWISLCCLGCLQQRIYHGRKFNAVEELKRTIITEWQCFRWQQHLWVHDVTVFSPLWTVEWSDVDEHIKQCNLALLISLMFIYASAPLGGANAYMFYSVFFGFFFRFFCFCFFRPPQR